MEHVLKDNIQSESKIFYRLYDILAKVVKNVSWMPDVQVSIRPQNNFNINFTYLQLFTFIQMNVKMIIQKTLY